MGKTSNTGKAIPYAFADPLFKRPRAVFPALGPLEKVIVAPRYGILHCSRYVFLMQKSCKRFLLSFFYKSAYISNG
jgi:hypothetical protein